MDRVRGHADQVYHYCNYGHAVPRRRRDLQDQAPLGAGELDDLKDPGSIIVYLDSLNYSLMKLLNFASVNYGARILDCSSEVEGCEADNVLNDKLSRLWLSDSTGSPQFCSVSLANLRKDICIRTLGWQCWHAYTTNPHVVTIHVSSDGFIFKAWDTFTARQATSPQLFCCAPISLSIYPFIAFEIVKTFGGTQTYMNRIFLYSDEIPSGSPQSGGSNSSTGSASAIVANVNVEADSKTETVDKPDDFLIPRERDDNTGSLKSFASSNAASSVYESLDSALGFAVDDGDDEQEKKGSAIIMRVSEIGEVSADREGKGDDVSLSHDSIDGNDESEAVTAKPLFPAIATASTIVSRLDSKSSLAPVTSELLSPLAASLHRLATGSAPPSVPGSLLASAEGGVNKGSISAKVSLISPVSSVIDAAEGKGNMVEGHKEGVRGNDSASITANRGRRGLNSLRIQARYLRVSRRRDRRRGGDVPVPAAVERKDDIKSDHVESDVAASNGSGSDNDARNVDDALSHMREVVRKMLSLVEATRDSNRPLSQLQSRNRFGGTASKDEPVKAKVEARSCAHCGRLMYGDFCVRCGMNPYREVVASDELEGTSMTSGLTVNRVSVGERMNGAQASLDDGGNNRNGTSSMSDRASIMSDRYDEKKGPGTSGRRRSVLSNAMRDRIGGRFVNGTGDPTRSTTTHAPSPHLGGKGQDLDEIDVIARKLHEKVLLRAVREAQLLVIINGLATCN